MQTNIRTRTKETSTANQLYTLAGIGALLFVVASLAATALTDWNNPAATSTLAIVLGVVGFIALLPVLLGVYQHLRPASEATSTTAIVCGVLALIGAVTGTVVGYEGTLGIVSGMISSFGLFLFFGLSGYLALTSKLLPTGWAILTILLGILAVAALIISAVADSSSALTGLTWMAFNLVTVVWALWTAVEFLRRGRSEGVRT